MLGFQFYDTRKAALFRVMLQCKKEMNTHVGQTHLCVVLVCGVEDVCGGVDGDGAQHLELAQPLESVQPKPVRHLRGATKFINNGKAGNNKIQKITHSKRSSRQTRAHLEEVHGVVDLDLHLVGVEVVQHQQEGRVLHVVHHHLARSVG